LNGSAILDYVLAQADKNSADTAYRALALKWLNLVIKDLQNSQQSFHFRFLEKTATLTLVGNQLAYDLATAFTDIDTEKTINVYDKINDYPIPYVDYTKFRQLVAKESDNSGDPRICTIFSGDLLLFPVNDYTALTGTQTDITALKLRDASATFITDGVKVGMKVTNTVTGLTALVTAVDSEIALTLDTDIMLALDTYSISAIVYVDYVKKITAATDTAVELDISDKYEKVVIDGIMEFAYQLDPELGSRADQHSLYEQGKEQMKQENSQIIAENMTPVSHRAKRQGNSDARNSVLFPLDTENM
jgi:hypothetical protein